MRRAAEQLRGGEAGDPASVREATARLLDRLADRELDVYTHGDAANLADRILAGNPYRASSSGPGALPSGYNNGSDRVR